MLLASSPAVAALSNTTADAAAVTYVNTMATRLGLTPAQKTAALANYKELIRALYTALKADITITITAGSIVTTGSAATQTGPAAPIPLNPQ
jgi:hypothetical protein